jgi:hypothetical protein
MATPPHSPSNNQNEPPPPHRRTETILQQERLPRLELGVSSAAGVVEIYPP